MAQEGNGYKEILEYFYNGVTLNRAGEDQWFDGNLPERIIHGIMIVIKYWNGILYYDKAYLPDSERIYE